MDCQAFGEKSFSGTGRPVQQEVSERGIVLLSVDDTMRYEAEIFLEVFIYDDSFEYVLLLLCSCILQTTFHQHLAIKEPKRRKRPFFHRRLPGSLAH